MESTVLGSRIEARLYRAGPLFYCLAMWRTAEIALDLAGGIGPYVYTVGAERDHKGLLAVPFHAAELG